MSRTATTPPAGAPRPDGEGDPPVVGIRQQRQQQTRRSLLDAAMRVFATHGYAGASMPRIAQEAGVSTGAIYANFTGKQDLFLAMMRRTIEAGARSRERTAEDDLDRDQLLRSMAAGWTATVESAPELVLLATEFWLYAMRNPPHEQMVAELLVQVRVNLAGNILDAGVSSGPEHARRMASAVQAAAYGYAMAHLVDPEGVTRDELVDTVRWIVDGATAST